MENASKALIMAASVLVGVMILSIVVYLFYTYGQYSAETYKKMEDAQIAQFNSQFLKYYGSTGLDQDEPIQCTIHDIISLANLAKQNNISNDVDNVKEYEQKENTYYIAIDIGNKTNIQNYSNAAQIDLIKNNSTVIEPNGIAVTKYYKCIQADVSNSTKRVYYMKFEEY